MPEDFWKRVQRAILRRWDGERCGELGEACADGRSEVHRRQWELKCRDVPLWIQDALQQAGTDLPAGYLRMVVVKKKGESLSRAIVIMQLDEFEAFYGP